MICIKDTELSKDRQSTKQEKQLLGQNPNHHLAQTTSKTLHVNEKHISFMCSLWLDLKIMVSLHSLVYLDLTLEWQMSHLQKVYKKVNQNCSVQTHSKNVQAVQKSTCLSSYPASGVHSSGLTHLMCPFPFLFYESYRQPALCLV